jgi:phosphoglucosamine mutase
MLAECLVRADASLDQAASIMQSYPQVLVNVRTDDRVHDPVAAIADEIARIESELGSDGRILVRASGTEPVVRVMVEAGDESTATRNALRLAEMLVDAHGGTVLDAH